MSFKIERGVRALKDATAGFLARESDRTSLITVTSLSISPDFSKATIFVTIYPEDNEKEALDFLKRKRGELRTYLGEKVKMRKIPFLDFALDQGEKNRQHIEDLIRE